MQNMLHIRCKTLYKFRFSLDKERSLQSYTVQIPNLNISQDDISMLTHPYYYMMQILLQWDQEQ